MFVETNDIEVVLFNIDGLLTIDGVRTTSLKREQIKIEKLSIISGLDKALPYLKERYQLKLISSFGEDFSGRIHRRLSLPSGIEVFNSTNSIEEILVKGQIIRAISTAGKIPASCVYVAGDIFTIQQAQSLRIGTIFWGYDQLNEENKADLLMKGPDFLIDNDKEFIDIFEKKYLGYYGEVESTPFECFGKVKEGAYINSIIFPNDEIPEFPILVSGRYFRFNDPRNRKHALSIRILDSKRHMARQKENFARIIGGMILHHFGDDFDFITRVPPKPAQTEDRLGQEIEHTPSLTFRNKRKIPAGKIKPDLLKCTRDYTPQKEMGSYLARRENVRDAFELKGRVNGKTIVVVDDITTSQATLKEITKLLKENGAKKIIPLALCYHPENLPSSEETLLCQKCKEPLAPRCRGSDGRPFYGCPNFFTTEKCKGGIDFGPGVGELNKQIPLEQFEPPEDVSF